MREKKTAKRCSATEIRCKTLETIRTRDTSSGDGRNKHHLVTILKGVIIATEKTNVFIVHVDVNEAPQSPGLVLDLSRKCWKALVDLSD